MRRLGKLGLMDASRVTLAEFGQEWLVAYAVPNLEPKTLRTYESLWDRHVLPNIGGVELRQLRPAVLDQFLAQLQRDGLSPASVKKVAGMLQGVLQRAVEWERIAQNPMRVAHKPRARRRIVIRPIAPAQVEHSGSTSSPTADCAAQRARLLQPATGRGLGADLGRRR
jgi:integrase